MKTSLLTLALAAISIVHAHAQGTIQFANNAGTRFTVDGVRPRNTADGGPAPNTFFFAVFAGATPDTVSDLPAGPLGGNTATGGLFTAPNPNAYQIAGYEPGTVVYLQFRFWQAAAGQDWRDARAGFYYFAETAIRPIQLGPAQGPGTVVWGNGANQFGAMNTVLIPEPSMIALAVVGGVAVMFLRKKSK